MSSTTARLSNSTRIEVGRFVPARASTPSAKAMSVATGIAQPLDAPGAPRATARNTRAGATMPPSAATTGRTAARASESSPTTSSRLSSRPATKKNTASRPSATSAPALRWFRCNQDGPKPSCASQTSR